MRPSSRSKSLPQRPRGERGKLVPVEGDDLYSVLPREEGNCNMSAAIPFRVLVVDDTPAIHDDYRKVLCRPAAAAAAAVSEMEALLFGEDSTTDGVDGVDDATAKPSFVLDSAFQ